MVASCGLVQSFSSTRHRCRALRLPMSKEIRAIAAEPAFCKQLEEHGYTVVAGTPEEYVAQVKKDVELFSKVIP